MTLLSFKWKIFSSFVCFSEFPNFTTTVEKKVRVIEIIFANSRLKPKKVLKFSDPKTINIPTVKQNIL